ncbi:Sporulation-specific cell division protein SsgB [Streptomyces sp. RB5]|uniref:Sporulation-specific cell division protein SsgB n=1 Tax=Streptomyces smaragdinus TaxID=2585196 RepID=A0A7K0CT72_9ACTN|nr:SsgA family sporulation/cell division regulator [Streptomyces smaragdinus]MQY16669.1 Sporulation-specific cell division protein SsgB [Streptomyces smaragdinus]
MHTPTHTEVVRDLDVRLVLSPDRGVDVPARLTYLTADPYAVRFTFHTCSPAPVHWTFARELLVEGVFRPCGQGDVRLWPTKVDGRNVVCLALASPDGDALIEAPAAAVSAWLERTMRLVPPGRETTRQELDAALERLLAPTVREACDDLWAAEPWPSEDPGPEA